MKQTTCCFTGHRDIPENERAEIEKRLETEVKTLINQGVTYFGCGGALGFDTMAAELVLTLKQSYPHIKLILVLPCKDQTRGWRPGDIAEYERIKSAADKVVYTSESYFSGCMQKRNRHLVDHSGYCISYLRKPNGGTKYTVDYAVGQGVRVVRV